MGKTIIEKIIENHTDGPVKPGDVVDLRIDARIARDFGGANVVKNIKKHNLSIQDPGKTFFTFDCNPGGSDQSYAANQQLCRIFARENGIRVYDINAGIGTHLAIDEGFVGPGETLVSTDSHANIVGAVGAFGQGMGDKDIAYTFAHGEIWFKVPPTMKITLQGKPSSLASAKDVVLAMLRELGASGLLGFAVELYGEWVKGLSLSSRVTIASMATEMGGICILFPPNIAVEDHYRKLRGKIPHQLSADDDADYLKGLEIGIEDLPPLISRPGHPEDVVPVAAVRGKKIDSVFIGSCTNGRYEDLLAVAKILQGKKVAPGVVLKIVPSTDRCWQRCLREGLLSLFKEAGALVGNAGCAGCAAGQIGQNGPGEVTVSTGNRNFPGKQGLGEVYLASPATAAASAVAGQITTADKIPERPAVFVPRLPLQKTGIKRGKPQGVAISPQRPTVVRGRVWVIKGDDIDTDMIYHNRYLAITEFEQMGRFAFSNLSGWKDFPQKAKPGDIIVAGQNFGRGSSRQQAVDCFRALGIGMIIAKSFASIYERNAINVGFPIMEAGEIERLNLHSGDEVEVDFLTGRIEKLSSGEVLFGQPFSKVQLEIYQKGGLLERGG